MRIISGTLKGRRLHSPESQNTRPTSDRLRETIFNILAHGWPEKLAGARVADIFAGSGAMGIEAISRGAAVAVFVEKHSAGRALVSDNLEALEIADKARVIKGDARQLPPIDAPFDLIFMDPPYRRGLGEAALAALPKAGWLKPDTLVVLESATDEQLELPKEYEAVDHRQQGSSQVFFLLAKDRPLTD